MYSKLTGTLFDTLYLLEAPFLTSYLLSLILDSYQKITLSSCTASSIAVHCSTFQFQGFYLFIPRIRITLKRTESQVPLGFILLDHRLKIYYITNGTYIFEPVKCWLIQVNCLLNLRYEFKYSMMVNIIRYKDGLIYTYNAQSVHYLSSYVGFRLPPLLKHVLSTFCYIFINKII